MGGGGKTGALRLLAWELAADGRRVVATTTTAMFLRELSEVGQVVTGSTLPGLMAGLGQALAEGGAVGVALGVDDQGKAISLPSDWVDRLWVMSAAGSDSDEPAGGAAARADHFPARLDYLLVEADGSRGRPLKVFGADEPQVPDATTTILQVAGLDALGAVLSEGSVHRSDSLASELRVPLGSPITASILEGCLRSQLRSIRRRWPTTRVVTLLNKAERPEQKVAGLELADRLLRGPVGDEGSGTSGAVSDAVVVGSLKNRRFTRVQRSARVVAIVLAAGRGTRMGVQKVLLPLGRRALVQRVVDAALGSRATETIVVVGHEAGSVVQVLRDRPVTFVVNPDHAQGMSTSLHAGLGAVRPGCDAAVFLLGDQPFVTPAVIDRLIERFVESGEWVVRPVLGDRQIHPVLMSAALFPEIIGQRGDVGGRAVARRHPERVGLVAVDDVRLDLDVDTDEDYETALQLAQEERGD